MNSPLRKLAASGSVLTVLLSLAACGTSDEGKGSTEITRAPGHASEITTYTGTATVTGIDRTSRQVTLTTPDGERRTYVLGPEVRNFDQIHIGDRVRATLTQEVALTLNRTDGPPSTSQGTAVTRAPEGSTPSGAIANTRQVTGRIMSINDRDVTLQFADGEIRKITVDKDVDLSGLRPGYFVTARVTEAVALSVEKP